MFSLFTIKDQILNKAQSDKIKPKKRTKEEINRIVNHPRREQSAKSKSKTYLYFSNKIK